MANPPPSEPQTSNHSNSSPSTTGIELRRLQSLDNHAVISLLHYIIRQRTLSDHVINSIFLALPLSGPLPPSLKKRILLRRLASDLSLRCVSYKTLETLELIEELDRHNGVSPPSEYMKAAYCATAASCTAAAIRRSVGDFYDTVHRLWLLRFCDLAKSPAKGLLSEQLRQMRDIMWEAVKNPGVRPLVASDELEQTLERIQFYLREVWDVDHLFPQEAVGYIVYNGADLRDSRPSVSKRRNTACADGTELERHLIERGAKENEIAEPMDESGSRSVPGGSLVINNETSWQLDPNAGEEASKLVHPDQKGMEQEIFCDDAADRAAELLAKSPEEACNNEFKGYDGLERMDEVDSASKVGTEEACTKGKMVAISLNKHLELSCSKEMEENQSGLEVNVLADSADKVLDINPDEACKDEFKGDDSLERRDEMVSASKVGVEDASMMGKEAATSFNKHLDLSCSKGMEENQSGHNINVLVDSGDKVLDINPYKENPSPKNNNTASVPRASLMGRNLTAHTLEWTESSPRAGRFHLPSPQREGFSPLKLIDDKKYVKRRKRVPWSLLEEETLINAVKGYGKGSWKAILTMHREIFKERNEVDLKDKWRNLTKSRRS